MTSTASDPSTVGRDEIPTRDRDRETFRDRMAGEENNFNTIRLLLAVLVVFCHSFYSLYRGQSAFPDPIHSLTHGQFDTGKLAVYGFFAISGCLVTASFDRSRTVRSYFSKRVLRIYPGFIACYLVCLFVVLPLSGITEAQFKASIIPPVWIAKMALLRGFGGVVAFPTHPEPFLNPSLWSIPVEFACYILVAIVGVLGLLRRAFPVMLVYLGSLCLIAAEAYMSLKVGGALGPVPGMIGRIASLSDRLYCLPVSFFLAGMTLYVYRAHVRRSFRVFLASLVFLAIASQIPPMLYLALPTCGVYALFYVAYGAPWVVGRIVARGDLSYGIYLYGWPVQQLVLEYCASELNPWVFFIISTPLAAAVAWCSWTFVERPALRLKRRA